MTKTLVWAHTVVEGLHRWADCPLEEVSYLRSPHRHRFGIKAYYQVEHNDRDVEFICESHAIRDFLNQRYYDPDIKMCDFGNRSCEAIAHELMDAFNLVSCEVDEDGENGAIVIA